MLTPIYRSKENSTSVPGFWPLISGNHSKCDMLIFFVFNAQTIFRRTNQQRVLLYAMLHTCLTTIPFISIPYSFHTAFSSLPPSYSGADFVFRVVHSPELKLSEP